MPEYPLTSIFNPRVIGCQTLTEPRFDANKISGKLYQLHEGLQGAFRPSWPYSLLSVCLNPPAV